MLKEYNKYKEIRTQIEKRKKQEKGRQ